MATERVTLRDIGLVGTGLLSLAAGGTWGVGADGTLDLVPLGVLCTLAVLSFALAWADVQSRSEP